MPNSLTRLSLAFVDAKGYYSHMRLFASVDTAADFNALIVSLLSALAPLTNADINGGVGGTILPPVPGALGTQATFGSVEDKAVMTYVAVDGSISRFKIPAPSHAMFLADGMTVDAANTDVVALNQVILNAAAGPTFFSQRSQIGFSIFAGGLRTRVRTQRRISIFTRNPQETGPAE